MEPRGVKTLRQEFLQSPKPVLLGSWYVEPRLFGLFSMDLLGKLAALVTPPRYNPVRYQGILAPSARRRSRIVPVEPQNGGALTRISHGLSTAAADPGMSTALRSVGLIDVLSSTPAEPSVADRKYYPRFLKILPVSDRPLFRTICMWVWASARSEPPPRGFLLFLK